MLTKDDRVEIIKESISNINNVKVESFDGLLVDYARKNDTFTIIRFWKIAADLLIISMCPLVTGSNDPG